MSTKIILCVRCKNPILDYEAGNNLYFCKRCEEYIPIKKSQSRITGFTTIPNQNEHIKYRISEDQLDIKFRWYRTLDLTNPVLEEDIFDIEQLSTFEGYMGYLFNSTKISIDKYYFQIKHTPFNGMPDFYIQRNHILAISVHETERSKQGRVEKKEFGLFAQTNSDEKLVFWGLSKLTLEFMSQEMNRFLFK